MSKKVWPQIQIRQNIRDLPRHCLNFENKNTKINTLIFDYNNKETKFDDIEINEFYVQMFAMSSSN
jgi:hypothetical protein